MSRWSRQLVEAPALVALLGLAYVVGGVTFWYLQLAPTAGSLHYALFQLVMHVLFGGVILVLGVHIDRSELLDEERFEVIAWCYGGFTLMFALAFWGHLTSILNGALTTAFVSDFVVLTSLGGAFGAIAGVNWGRASKNRRLAERNEDQRETLALLTRLLSHDIRNDMAIAGGYADRLADHIDADGEGYLETVQRQIDETDRLLATANTLIKSLDEEREFEPVDLSRVLIRETERINQEFSAVDLEAEIPQGTHVVADELIRQVFSNLLQNAVVHNDPETLSIRVTADQTEDGVAVVVSDDGEGVPPEVQERCFELGEKGPESGGDGIGLYLVSRLVDLYGGSIDLDESPAGGARFRVTLPTPAS